MGLILFAILKQCYQRCQIYRRLNRLERIKLNGLRRKHRLPPINTYWDTICHFICLPFTLVAHFFYDFYQRIVTSIGSRGRKRRVNGHMRRVFKNFTDENKLFRKVLYFLFGLFLTFLVFVFLYSQHLLNNYPLIGTSIAFTVVFALISPFNEVILCLILIALPSMFSSKVRYVFVAYIFFILYFQVVPNIWNNGVEGIESFGCSVWQTGRGGKKMAGVLVEDIKQFIRDMKQKVRDIIDNMKKFFKVFDLNIQMPGLNLKALCNEPTDKDTYECEEGLTFGSLGSNRDKHRMYMPFICTHLWTGFAGLCKATEKAVDNMYKAARKELLEMIEKLERELYFDVQLNDDFDYHYNTSNHFLEQFRRIGNDFRDRHWLLWYLQYLFNVKVLILLVFSFWILIMFRYLRSDPFDNTYINEELLKIDQKRAQTGRETVIPLDINERKRFIYPFDPMMTPIEFNRFLFGISLISATFGQVLLYFALDFGVYNLVFWYNTFIDVLSDIFAPASIRIDFKGDSFLAKRLNRLNNGFDVKQQIVQRLQECKSIPMAPDRQVYKQILIYLGLTLVTLFSSAYGLRFRHYFAGLFYPHRRALRAVWLYNNILCRRGNIFQFWRKQMRKKVFGDKTGEDVSVLDRLCAQSVVIRVVCTLLGFYGKHKYCQMCGQKVKIDGSDQSVRCVQNCGAIYCFDCFGDRNNICSVCMNPIDYSEVGDLSEELDSSEEDIAYELQDEDFLYQYSDESKTPAKMADDWDDLSALQRKDLVSLAYRYDTVDQVPAFVYLVDNEDYDAEDESEGPEDYQRYLFSLEQELGIPAEQILQMKRNAKYLAAEDISQSLTNKIREEKYSQLKREDDQRLVKNALLMVSRDRRKHIKKSKTKLN